MNNHEIEQNGSTSVYLRIAQEIQEIAREIEELPIVPDNDLAGLDIMRLQQVDLCSQKLMDISSMVRELSAMEGIPDQDREEKLMDSVKLEYMQRLIAGARA